MRWLATGGANRHGVVTGADNGIAQGPASFAGATLTAPSSEGSPAIRPDRCHGRAREGRRSLGTNGQQAQSTIVRACSRIYKGRYQNDPIAFPVLPLAFQPPKG